MIFIDHSHMEQSMLIEGPRWLNELELYYLSPIRLCKLQKGCSRPAAASDKVYQLLAHGRRFSLGTPASSTSKTVRYDIAEILLKHQKSKSNQC